MAESSNGDYDVAAFSPASSVASSASAMSLSADASPVPSPADSTTSTESSASTAVTSELGTCSTVEPQSEASFGGKRKQAWDGGSGTVALDNDKRRRTTGSSSSSSAMPRPTHRPEYNEQLQGQASAHDYVIRSQKVVGKVCVFPRLGTPTLPVPLFPFRNRPTWSS